MADLLGRFKTWAWWQRAVILLILGAVAALGQAPLDWWWATLVAMALLLALWPDDPAPWIVFRHYWWAGVGYFAISLRWIVAPFQVDVAAHGWMAPFALILMAGGAAMFWGIAAAVAARLRGGRLGLALMLAGAEVLRSLILTGFPWALLGHIWVDTPLAHVAAFGGPHLLTMITILSAWGVAQGWRGIVPVSVIVAVGWVTLGSEKAIDESGPVVRLVQPNALQAEKWDPERRFFFFERMLDYTSADARPDLIVWPETAIPQLMNYAETEFARMTEAARGVPIVTGVNRADGDTYHNSLVVLDGEGFVSALYDKAHLVPFGEYVPFAGVLARLGVTQMNQIAGFTPGRDQGLIDLPGIGAARPLICYEGIFAEEIGTEIRPRLMVLITNDAWFGRGVGPQQHLAQARLRAIEQGLPMVRVANTGISAMIDGRGLVTARLDLNQTGFVDAHLPPALAPTAYSRWGDWPVIFILLFSILGIATRAQKSL